MAKRSELTNPFAPTEDNPKPAKTPALTSSGRRKKEPSKAIGVNLTVTEWEKVDEIVTELGIKRSELLAYAVRKFVDDYTAGRIQPVAKKSLPGL